MHGALAGHNQAKRTKTLKTGNRHPSSKRSSPTYACVVHCRTICIRSVTSA